MVGNEAKKHAVSHLFKEPIDPKGTGLVVQYELHMKKDLKCGGAYLKLLTASEELDHDGFKAETPYTIMFGPDKCGETNKVHFILRHKNPLSGEWAIDVDALDFRAFLRLDYYVRGKIAGRV